MERVRADYVSTLWTHDSVPVLALDRTEYRYLSLSCLQPDTKARGCPTGGLWAVIDGALVGANRSTECGLRRDDTGGWKHIGVGVGGRPTDIAESRTEEIRHLKGGLRLA